MPFRDSTLEMTDVLVRILIASAVRSVRRVNDFPLDLDHGQSSTEQYLKFTVHVQSLMMSICPYWRPLF